MNPTFIVWADPGLTTGLAWYDQESGRFQSAQYDPADLGKKLTELCSAAADRMVIGFEAFIVTSGGARTSTPKHPHVAIAQITTIAAEFGVLVLKPQPSSARALGSPAFLRRLGWYKPGKGHANDASQHLLAHLIRQKPMDESIREKLFPGYGRRGTLAP